MKKLFITLSLIFLGICASAQQVDMYKADLKTVVEKMRTKTSERIFYVAGPETFTISCSEEDFLSQAVKALEAQNYVISKTSAGWYIIKGRSVMTSLPKGFFLAGAKADLDALDAVKYVEVMADIENKTYEIGRKDRCKVKNAYLSGYIRDIKTMEPLIGVTLVNVKTDEYASSDVDGHYRIYLQAGECTLKLSGFGLEDQEVSVEIYEDGSLDLVMKEKTFSLNAAVVSADSQSSARNTTGMGKEVVRIESIKKMPAAMGEADVIKAVLTLPGVTSTGEASSGFNVRGGATDQNLVLFNQGIIYNTSHLFGLFSAFNSNVIKDVQLYKGSIPASYGGRISSVLDITGREGNSNKVTANLGIGLLTSHANIEGPIGESTRFVLAARTTYSDWLLGLLPEQSGYSNGTAGFFDLNASVTQQIGAKNTLTLSGYYSQDKFSFQRDTSYYYRNANASLRWRSNFSSKTSLQMSVGVDHYDYRYSEVEHPAAAFDMTFGVNDYFAKLGFTTTFADNSSLSYGFNGLVYDINPGERIPYADSYISAKKLDKESALEGAGYVSYSRNLTRWMTADAGLRYSFFANLNDGSFYHAPEIRANLKFISGERATYKIGFNTASQYIQMLSNTVSISPVDTWKLCDSAIRPQYGYQASAGAYYTLLGGKVETSAELYYKRTRNTLDYKSGYSILLNDHIDEAVMPMYGRSYGAELMAKKPHGSLNGWVSYTYSRSELMNMHNEGVYNVNKGGWYPASYDKPHQFKLVANYKLTHRFSVNLNVDYSTGRPVTIPVARYYIDGSFRLLYDSRNGYRIPDYFRTDLAFSIEPSHYLKQLRHCSVTLGVYNLTGRKNPYSVYYKTQGTKVQGYMLTVFGCQIPYITLNVNF